VQLVEDDLVDQRVALATLRRLVVQADQSVYGSEAMRTREKSAEELVLMGCRCR
jgi:hypothetical protein